MNYSEAKEAKNAVEAPINHFKSFIKFLQTRVVLEKPTMKENIGYVYLFVRQDLSLAQQNVQSIHASMKAGAEFIEHEAEKANLVYIGVPDKQALYEVMDILGRAQIPFVDFFEPDNDEGLTAICTTALFKQKQRSLFKSYDLWQPNLTSTL